jgi:fumarate reductase (CoM/CoB) subunit A
MDMKDASLQTDVLVIGAGGAGLRAAIEARSAGAEVLVVSKGGFPAGCTAVSMGGMQAAFDEQDSIDLHFEDTIRGGDYINNARLVRLLVDHAVERTKDLERYGTRFEKDGERYRLFPYTGSSVPRGVLALDPYRGGYVKGLVDEVKRLGITVLGNVMVVELLKDKNAVVGAAGLELGKDTFLTLRAGATILSSGGAGSLYRLTTNPAGMTGDGYALGYRAGARLQDMEFVQGRACMVYPEKMRGTPPPGDGLVTLGGRFYNALGERYMGKYHPEKMEQVTRAQMSICAQKEIRAGRGGPHGGVLGDLAGVPRADLVKYEGFMTACAEVNFDPTRQRYEWAPGAHHSMGGIVINEQCETGIPGLYACGEVAAGVNGSNRLAANALTETQVFGAIAGKCAARAARAVSHAPGADDDAHQVKARMAHVLSRGKGVDPREIRDELAETMSTHVGVIRDQDGLKEATRSLERIQNTKIADLCVAGDRSPRALAELLEAENLLIVARLITLGATLRKETRGAHHREDYPESNENWLKNIVLQRENDSTAVELMPIEEN